MKERPILFSGPMVRAILAGAKTQTRRVVKTCRQFREWDSSPSQAYDAITDDKGEASFLVSGDHGYTDSVQCPYGGAGDRLWVRETWAEADGRYSVVPVAYRADGEEQLGVFRWRPSIHMPRWASRITLEVTDVRVERLQTISEEDAKAEGVVDGRIPADEDGPERIGFVLGDDDGKCVLYPDARSAFENGWDKINGKRAPWASNPWVWVVAFRRAQ